MGGQEHGDDRQQRQHDVQRKAQLGDAGQVDAEEVHVLAELGNGSDLLGAEAAQHTAVASNHLCDDVGIAGDGGKGDAGGGQGLTGGGQSRSTDVEDALQRIVHDTDNAEHDKEVQQHGHAACGGVIAVVLLQLEHFFLLLFGLVLVLGLDLHHHGLEGRHFSHALLLAQLQRDLDDVDEQREDDDVPAVAREQLVDPLHDIAERTAQDVKEVHTFVHSAPSVARDLLFFIVGHAAHSAPRHKKHIYFSIFCLCRLYNCCNTNIEFYLKTTKDSRFRKHYNQKCKLWR